MPFELTIPEPSGTPLKISADVGQCIFVLGANGTGKSSLMHLFYRSNHSSARRISAHRQTWFSSSALTLSPQDKRSTEQNIHSRDTAQEARWKDDYAAQRANIAIYDLIDAENVRARSIAGAVDMGDFDLAKELSKKDAPIKIINELLRLSNIPISISVKHNEQVMASKSGSDPYSVAELSDGERNALLIAASVLTVPAGMLLLIDEPERHLHRSIISPLLTMLFSKRSDCCFVISTHDVMLPLDNPTSRTILIRGCNYNGSVVTNWDADLVPSEAQIDEDLKQDILGSRRKLLFIEGSERSLDKPLYSLLFPNVSVIAKSTCRDVEYAVSGIRGAGDLHWLHAVGIVDNDRRTVEDVNRLAKKGVYAVPFYSVESIYYHPEIQRLIAERHAAVTGEDPVALLMSAKDAAIVTIRPHVQRFCERAVEKKLREEIRQHWPKQSELAARGTINITIEVDSVILDERTRLESALENGHLHEIIEKYPVRESSALAEIARRLGFNGRDQYEGAVRKLLIDDNAALRFVRSLFDDLITDLGTG